MRQILFVLASVLVFVVAAKADDAHPAFWTVHGPRGTVTIVSSLHLLPQGTSWHQPELIQAMQSADSFVFEVPVGDGEHAEETQYILNNGLLPKGESLSAKLDDGGRRDYRRALNLAGMQEASLDQKQPWLAEVVLTVQAMYRHNYSARHTPESEASAFAATYGKEVRYLDSTRQQLDFLRGIDTTEDVTQFRTVLADFPNQAAREQRFVAAWATGDVNGAAALVDEGLKDLPAEMDRLHARNRDWARQIGHMLGEGRNFYVAVGIAHLVGSKGVPALLRDEGYSVEGP